MCCYLRIGAYFVDNFEGICERNVTRSEIGLTLSLLTSLRIGTALLSANNLLFQFLMLACIDLK